MYTLGRCRLVRLAGTAVVFFSFVSFAGLLGAETDNAPATRRDTLDEVVVVAQGEPATAFRAPHTVSIQDLGAFETNRLYRTASETLKWVPGVMVQKTANAHGSPYIRGFTGFHNVMLIDEVRLNNSVFRDGPNQYRGRGVEREPDFSEKGVEPGRERDV